jgi:ABC-type glycerol-3-phosphate transport system permease component
MAPTFGKHHSTKMTMKFTLHLYTNPLDYRFLCFITKISVSFVNVLKETYTNSITTSNALKISLRVFECVGEIKYQMLHPVKCENCCKHQNFQYLALVKFMKLKHWITHENFQCICTEQIPLLHYRTYFQDLWNYIWNSMIFCWVTHIMTTIIIPLSHVDEHKCAYSRWFDDV